MQIHNGYLRLRQSVGRSYAAVFFSERPVTGGVFLLATLLHPSLGLTGLLTVSIACALFALSALPPLYRTVFLCNSLLTGLAMASLWSFTMAFCGLLGVALLLLLLTSTLTQQLFWRWQGVSAFSLPFALTSALLLAIAPSWSGLGLAAHHQWEFSTLDTLRQLLVTHFPTGLTNFLSALGTPFFVADPLSGLVICIGLLQLSRYLLCLAVGGYLIGQWMLQQFSVSNPEIAHWAGFNFILVSIAIGGIYLVPGRISALVAGAAVCLTAVLLIALRPLLDSIGISGMALPFLLSTYSLLNLLTLRSSNHHPQLLLNTPDLPETHYEQVRLAQHRGSSSGLLHLRPPFQGIWEIYQGFHGQWTHQSPWQYALDFYQQGDGRSYRSDGATVSDYYCFAQPVCAPVAGTIVSIVDHCADNVPGQIDSHNNWGNYLMLRTPEGWYVLLAHLRQFSMQVQCGDWVVPGQILGLCGNSGRSPQPHLHLQVQQDALPGAATVPFRLCHSIVQSAVSAPLVADYRLSWVPEIGQRLQAAVSSTALQHALSLPLGRQMEYLWTCRGQSQSLILTVTVTLMGERRLVSASGASAAFIHNEQVLAFFDRQGPKEAAFDAWLLAMGLTPLETQEIRWQDSPSFSLSHSFSGTLPWFLRPLLPDGLNSQYQRSSLNGQAGWLQSATHQHRRTPLLRTEACLQPEWGLTHLRLWRNHQLIGEARLCALAQLADAGIPSWRSEYVSTTTLKSHSASLPTAATILSGALV